MSTTLQFINNIYILTLHQSPDNWFTLSFINTLIDTLDYISSNHPSSCALITISKYSKIYSNGLSLPEATTIPNYFNQYHKLLYKLLVLPIPTISAINGHAYAGGLMFALAHDYRVMRSDKGYLCMNEVDMPAALTPGMLSILRCKTNTPETLNRMIIQAHKFNAKEAKECGLIDVIAQDWDDVKVKAIELATKWAPKAQAGAVYGYLKEEMWRDASKDLQFGGLGLVAKNPDVKKLARL